MATKAKVLILVGFGNGNGLGIARVFGSAGFKLGLISRNPDLQGDSLAALAMSGFEAVPFPADAGVPESLEGAISEAVAQLGEADVIRTIGRPPCERRRRIYEPQRDARSNGLCSGRRLCFFLPNVFLQPAVAPAGCSTYVDEN
jgi:hypothetical protein